MVYLLERRGSQRLNCALFTKANQKSMCLNSRDRQYKMFRIFACYVFLWQKMNICKSLDSVYTSPCWRLRLGSRSPKKNIQFSGISISFMLELNSTVNLKSLFKNLIKIYQWTHLLLKHLKDYSQEKAKTKKQSTVPKINAFKHIYLHEKWRYCLVLYTKCRVELFAKYSTGLIR